jgi:hypothetical protein
MTEQPSRGLRPVLGARAEALDLAFLTGTEAERAHIAVTAELLRRQLGRAPLLDPPDQDQADGPIRLGRIVHGSRLLGWLGVRPHELTHHLLCIGRTGSGKSNLLVRLLLQLDVPWVAIDHKRSLRSLLALESAGPVAVVSQGRMSDAAMCFNPLVPPAGMSRESHLRQLVDLIAEAWLTGDGVRSLLVRCFEEVGGGTFRDALHMLHGLHLSSRERLWRVSAVRVLEHLTGGPLGHVFCSRSDLAALTPLSSGRTVLEVDGLGVADTAFLANILVRYLLSGLRAGNQRETLRLVLALDEAHHLLADTARDGEIARVLREGREAGLGCLLASQTFAGLSQTALANCGTLTVMSCRSRSDVHAAAQGLLLQDQQRELLSLLPVGEAVVRLSARWMRAVHVHVPALALPKGKVSDEDVRLTFLTGPYSREALDQAAGSGGFRDSGGSGGGGGPAGVSREVSGVSRADGPVVPRLATGETRLELCDAEPDAGKLLMTVGRQPLAPVTEQYAVAGLSRRKGNAIKVALEHAGYVRTLRVGIPQGQVVLLEITDQARMWLARHRSAIAPVHGSLPHAYWQQRVAQQLKASGWEVACEVEHDGHKFDVVATKDRRELFLEVETGKSMWLANLAALAAVQAAYRAVLWLDPASEERACSALPSNVQLVRPRQVAAWVAALDRGIPVSSK